MPTNFKNASYTGNAANMATRTLGARATDVFCVRDFLATSDTDWNNAIDKAMAASATSNGGIIYFPPGTYGLTRPIIPPNDQMGRKLVGCGASAQGKGTMIEGNFRDYLIAIPQNLTGNAPLSSIDGIWFRQNFRGTKGDITQVDSPGGPVSPGTGYGGLYLGWSFSSITNCTVQLNGGGVGIYCQGIENAIRGIQVMGQTSGLSTAPECIGIWLENGRIENGKVMTCRMGIVPVTNSGVTIENLNVERNQYGFWLASNPLAYYDRNASVNPTFTIIVNPIGTVTPVRTIVRNITFYSHGSLTEGGAFFRVESSGCSIENFSCESLGQDGFIPDHGFYVNGSGNVIRNGRATGAFNIAAFELVQGNNLIEAVTADATGATLDWKLPTASNSTITQFLNCNVSGALPLSVIGTGGTAETYHVEISDSMDPAFILPDGPSNIGKPIVGGGTHRVIGRWNGMGWAIAGGDTGVLDGDPVTMFLARTTGLDGAHITAYTNLINALVAAGLLSATNGTSAYFDALLVSATDTQPNGLVSLINGKPRSTVSGTVTFTPNRGFSVSGGGNGIFTNVGVTGGTYSLNSAHMSVWVADNPSTTNPACGLQNTSSPTDWAVTSIYPRSSADGNAYYRITDRQGTPSAGITTATAQGHYLANRTTIDTQQGYKNGTNQGVTSIVNSTGGNRFFPPANNVGFCALTNLTTLPATFGTGFPGQIAAFSFGGSLNSTQVTAFYNALRAYMTAVGVP